ncbi:MAG: peptide deformylase [Candidatus Liptonbacteria bacterium]|nr:peptide deformylase [Candidatus Liptonbacteria bacterium]
MPLTIADHIFLITDKEEYKFLRRKTKPFDFSAHTPKEIQELLAKMKKAMHAAKGIGLSANQIGVDAQVFIAEVQGAQGETKFYAVFNPKIEKVSKEMEISEEGCLSIPKTFGEVPRAREITIKGQDKKGKPIKIKAWALLARVFQHEMDHLNGMLFIDRATSTYEIPASERLARKAPR